MRLVGSVFALTVMSGLATALLGAGPATKPGPVSPAATLPYQAMPAERTDPGAVKMHQAFLARGKAGPIGVLFIGDSITAGWQGPGNPVWKKNFEPLNAADFGISSDGTSHVLWRITAGGELDGIDPKVVVLLIGTNNIGSEPKAVTVAITKIVETIRQKLPKSEVLLLAIFPRGKPDDLPKMMEHVKAVNAELAKLDDGKNVRFLDLGEKLAPEGKVTKEVFADGVHLTPKGFEIWAQGMMPLLKKMME